MRDGAEVWQKTAPTRLTAEFSESVWGQKRAKASHSEECGPGEERVSRPTFAAEDGVLLGWTDVCVDVQAVSFI